VESQILSPHSGIPWASISLRWSKNFKNIPLGFDKSGSPPHGTGGQVHNVPTGKSGEEIGQKKICKDLELKTGKIFD